MTDNLSRDTGATVRRHRGGQCAAAVPPALRAGPQSDRDGLLQLKAPLRKAAERTREGLRTDIGRIIGTITPDQGANLLAATVREAN